MQIMEAELSSRELLDQMRGNQAAFFVYGFPKKDKDNIKTDEIRWFKKMAKSTFALSEEQLEQLITTGNFIPVEPNEND